MQDLIIKNNKVIRKEQKKALTYIELLITIAIIAILLIPTMRLFSHSLYSTGISQEFITATNLAKWQMERTKNLNLTKAGLEEMGDYIYPPLEEEPFKMNSLKWRIKREIVPESNPLEVRIHTYQEGQMDKPIVSLVTLFEDMTWEEVHPIK